jgi:AraC-like DNA-binding protein
MTTSAVAALVIDAEGKARLRTTLQRTGASRSPSPGSGAEVQFYDTVAELLAALGTRRLAVVVVQSRDRNGAPTDEAVRVIRAGYPSVAVIAYVPPGPACSTDILALARAGVHELVLRGVDDIGIALRAAVASAARRAIAERVLRDVAPLVAPGAVGILRYCLEHAAEAPTVVDVGRALGIHRKTLVNRTRAAALPPPRALLAWCRLLLAADLLEDPLRPVEQAALVLDFPSGTAFRNMLRRYTGLGPRDVRENGGLVCVLHAFRRALTSNRDMTRTPVRSAPILSHAAPESASAR